MREYKFRGKRQYDGEWVYGGIEEEGYSYVILTEESAVCAEEGGEIVIQETIGQYTGLKDKNGVEIYEGDIVERVQAEDETEEDGDEWGWRGAVEWYNGDSAFYVSNTPYSLGSFCPDDCLIVIGNIYDNPELLEEKAK